MKRILAAIAVVAVVVLVRADPASAHAELEGTDPPDGAQLDTAPDRVVLGFTEGVDVRSDGVRVLDSAGQPIDAGEATHPDGQRSRVEVTLPELGDGLYVVSWRVTSSDSHPISGAFTFTVGDVTGDPAAALAAAGGAVPGGSDATGWAFGLIRFLAFAALVVLVGGGASLTLAPAIGPRPILWGALAVLAVATIAGIGVQGAYSGGTGLASAFDGEVVGDVLGTQFGRMWLARLLLCIAAIPLLLLWADVRRARHLQVAAALVGLGLLVTTALSGHASAGDAVALAVVADVVHLAAGAWWLAGLGLLALVVLRPPTADPEGTAAVADRFSRSAAIAVVVIVVTGAFQSWRQVRSLDALDTDYARLLMVKVAAVAGLLLIAALSRAAVRRRLPLERLRRAVVAEALIGVVVIGVTAALVNAPPARSAAAEAPAGTFAQEVHTATLAIDVRVDPAAPGPNQVDIAVGDHFGGVIDAPEVTATVAPASGGALAPIDVPLARVGPGRWAAPVTIPFPGEWVLDVAVRTTDIDLERAEVELPIR